LRLLPPFAGQLRLAFFMQRNSKFEAGFGLLLVGAAVFEAAFVIVVGKDEFALVAFGDPVAEGVDVGGALGADDFSGDLEFLIFWGRGFRRSRDAAGFVDPDAGGDVDQLIGGADGVRGVDDGCVGGLGGVVPLACGSLTAGVLSGSDEFESFGLQFFVNGLPDRQIKTASSPGGPGEQEYFAAAEILELDLSTFAVLNAEVWGLARFEVAGAEQGNGAKTPEIAFADLSLLELGGKSSEIDRAAIAERLVERDADVTAAGTLGFDFEAVDRGEVFRLNPEFGGFDASIVESDFVIVAEDRCFGRCSGEQAGACKQNLATVEHDQL